jgi:hypothetical protein
VLAQDAARPLQQALARLRQHAPAGRADEERHPDLQFELPDLHADRRLRDVDAPGGGGEGVGLGDGRERPQLSNLHRRLGIRYGYRADKIF